MTLVHPHSQKQIFELYLTTLSHNGIREKKKESVTNLKYL